MKKIIYLAVAMIIALTLTACIGVTTGDGTTVSPNTSVRLASIEENVEVVKGVKRNSTSETTGTTSTTTSVEEVLDYQYKVLNKTDNLLDLRINLDNPNNYYIFDYKITSSDEFVEILIEDEYVTLNTVDSLRWNGQTNHYTVISLRFNTQVDFDLTIENIYYSEKETGENKTSVNLNNKENFSIFKLEQLQLELVDVVDNTFNYNVIADSRAIIEPTLSYTLPSEGEPLIEIDYQYQLKENLIIDAKYVGNVKEIYKDLFYITTERKGEDINMKLTTDFEVFTIKIKDNVSDNETILTEKNVNTWQTFHFTPFNNATEVYFEIITNGYIIKYTEVISEIKDAA